ncbi:uncharacterized protein PAC_00901 [Phialocephala subalpina]|uniref:NAD-dependent epimerase/dehydratase domain-containing protein n=1 Tax=Phialocephala subalpina TaxID=576137 RepID=A0A1L7WE31_9HELO|nr:uncharacterized protein PAC_00901 [Phialocephala subalpina]
MASKPTILLTGATGSLGSTILYQLLALNTYNVLAVLRSYKKSGPFLEKKYASNIKNGTLQLIEIPDMTVPGSFDIPASKSDFIIHVATPLTKSNFEESIIKPTWEIDHNILLAASKSPSVKRVIICSSIVAVVPMPFGLFKKKVYTENNYNTITPEEATANEKTAYSYAKTNAEKKAWAFMENEGKGMGFDLVTLCAPSITGKCIQEGFVPSKEMLGGTGSIYDSVFDRTPEEGLGFLYPFIMDFEDVSKIHVKSLDKESVPGGRYVFHTKDIVSANMVARKVREEFPEFKGRVLEPAEDTVLGMGKVKGDLCVFDVGKSERVFGGEWKGWWESIKKTVEQIVEYERAAGKL